MPLQKITHRYTTWVNIIQPTPDDIEILRADYPHFHPLDLEDLLSRIERPKLDEYDDYLFTVMHFPIWNPVQKISRPSEVDSFVGIGYLVTVHDGRLKPLANLFKTCQEEEKARELYMGRGASRLFYTAIDQLVDYIFPILYKVDSNIRDIEEDIFESDARNVIQTLAFIRRDNIALRRIVRPQITILENLENTDRAFMRDDLDVYFGDIRDHLNKAADLIQDHTEVIEGLADTANTLANYRTNEVMRVLTVISVLMMPMTLISGIYGMNIALPFQEHPVAFIIVMTLMFSIASGMTLTLYKKGWL